MAFAKMIAGAIMVAFAAVWFVVRTPAQALYRCTRRLLGYHS
ncbi:hypothetical protein [Actinoplanes subglobosus]|uniref:Uncharacterized protein n=1 Tax=Actinoplanes subglobosus TaxID=1547892 RepID=A0ABV8J5G2_9ACTN